MDATRAPFPALLLAALATASLLACGGSSDTTGPGGQNDLLRDPPPSTQRTVQNPTLTLTVLKTVASTGGGGDAVLVADSSGSDPLHVLIDAGDDGTTAAYLTQAGIDTLDMLILTHAHYDHFGGMDEVFDAVQVKAFVYNGQVRSQTDYQALLAMAQAEADTVVTVGETESWFGSQTGQMTLTLLPPLGVYVPIDTDDGRDLNNGSLGIHLRRGSFTFLSTGDAEETANGRFARDFSTWVDVEALKVGHHGSTDATNAAWLAATSPQVAVVSANGTTHPHGGVLELLRTAGLELFCTPQHGRVTFRVETNGSYAVSTEYNPRFRCEKGSAAY